jgi:hypothetical protein
MKDPTRIPEIVDTITKLWEQCPDLRLGQIICNSLPPDHMDPYYVEDDELLTQLKKTLDLYNKSV